MAVVVWKWRELQCRGRGCLDELDDGK